MNVRSVALVLVLAEQVDHRLLNMLIHLGEVGLRVNAAQFANIVVVVGVQVLSLFLFETPAILVILNSL